MLLPALLPLSTRAQFVSQISSNVLAISNDVAVDNAGNVYVTGGFDGTATFPDSGPALTSIGRKDIFVARYNPAGQPEWAFGIGGIASGPGVDDEGLSIAVSPAGHLFVTGYFQGTADFDPGSGIAEVTSYGFRDVFLASYTSDGQLRWVDSFGGAADDRGQGVGVFENEAVYFTGFFRETARLASDAEETGTLTSVGEEDGFLIRMDQAGGFDWNLGYGNISVDKGARVGVDDSGNVYLAGVFSQTVDFDPGAEEAVLSSLSGSQDGMLATYSPAGSFLRVLPLGSPQLDGIAGMAVDGTGDVYLIGNFIGTLDFDPLNEPQAIVSLGIDQYIARYTPAGALAWVYTLGSGFAQGSDIAINEDAILVSGIFGDNLFPDPNSTFALESQGEQDIMLASYSKDGAFRWGQAIGGVLSETATAVTLSAEGEVYLTGFFQDEVDFAPDAGTAILSSSGTFDGFLVRYAPDGSLPVSTETPQETGDLSHLTAYPNPAANRVVVTVDAPLGTPVTLAVFDVLGRQIDVQATRTHAHGQTRFDLALTGIRAGFYFVRVSNGSRQEIAPITVVNK